MRIKCRVDRLLPIPINLHRQFLILIWHTIFTAIQRCCVHVVCVGSLSSLKWIWTSSCCSAMTLLRSLGRVRRYPIILCSQASRRICSRLIKPPCIFPVFSDSLTCHTARLALTSFWLERSRTSTERAPDPPPPPPPPPPRGLSSIRLMCHWEGLLDGLQLIVTLHGSNVHDRISALKNLACE